MEPYSRSRRSEGSARTRRRPAALAAAALALLAAGCAGAPEEPAAESDLPLPASAAARETLPPGFPETTGRILAPGRAPTPYTAAEIRDSYREGRTYTWQRVAAAGRFVEVQRIVSVNAAGARFQSLLTREDGVQTWSHESDDLTWVEFQAHASFPLEATSIRAERIRVPAGEYDCWVYEVTERDTLTTWWFAQSLPGPPVRVEIRQGSLFVLTMDLIELKLAEPESR